MDKEPWSGVHAQIHRQLRARLLLPAGASLLAAISGGQDSITLLKLLVDLQTKWRWQVRVAHCDHRWRPDSAENAAFVKDLCDLWQVPCQVVTAETTPATEAEARQWRYAVLGTLAQQTGCTYIATGHTASDRAETLLYNLLRGSGSDGLQALAWQRPLHRDQPNIQVVRPLLAITRAETAAFCQQFHLPIWADATNQDITYTRNRIRLELMPYLQKHFNRQIETTLAHTAELLTAEVDWLEQMAQEWYEAVVQFDPDPPTWRLHRRPLRHAHLALQRRVLRRVLQQVTTTQVSFEAIEKLVALIHAPNRTQTDPFTGGWIAIVDADWIVLRLSTEGPDYSNC